MRYFNAWNLQKLAVRTTCAQSYAVSLPCVLAVVVAAVAVATAVALALVSVLFLTPLLVVACVLSQLLWPYQAVELQFNHKNVTKMEEQM